jgi:hypothetical protein
MAVGGEVSKKLIPRVERCPFWKRFKRRQRRPPTVLVRSVRFPLWKSVENNWRDDLDFD